MRIFFDGISIMRIILCPNVSRDISFEKTLQVAKLLESHGVSIVICPVYDDETPHAPPLGIELSELDYEIERADMIITFGGDGTILRAARTAADCGLPILGVNMGGKGFMAELEVDEIGLISSVASGKYDVESRMMLAAELVRGSGAVYSDFALNDIVIRGYNKVIELSLFGDGQLISKFTGDGAVIATPTGSTAYSMAAGGPIVEPSAHNIIITPICAHVLEAKPFVLVSDRHVSVEIGFERHNPAYMSADGCERVDIHSGDVISVKKSQKHTRLVRLSNRSFYSKVSEKLGERL